MKIFLTCILIFTILIISAQNRDHAFDVNQRLGRGVNLGNMFEAPTETAWGNPWNLEYPKIISDLGFNHVRIPIRWETNERSLSQPPYTINNAFLERIKEAVDACASQGLMAIINMHHHENLFESPDLNKARFLEQWNQIAAYFKDYPDTLIFEILNEPHGNITPEKWNVFLVDALAEIRETNENRVVFIGTAEYGGLGGLSSLVIPSDDNLILSIHYYNPFSFTHQGAEWVDNSDAWLGTEWNDTQTERDVVAQELNLLKQIGQNQNIPVNIGEFGAYSTSDISFRSKWTTFLGRYFEQQNWSWAYWEFSAGFGFYNPITKEFNDLLVDALLHNEMPEPSKYSTIPIYASNFSSSNDGWTLSNQGGASSILTRTNNTLKVAISNGGTQGWHIQLTKSSFNLESGKTYRLKFKTKSASNKSFTTYVGMNKDPWSIYGYTNGTATSEWQDFQLVFKMLVNESTARIVFDLGNSLGDIELTDIVFEQVYFETLGVEIINESTVLFPNPAETFFNFENSHYDSLTIYDMQGRKIEKKELISGNNKINISQLKSGIYVILFIGSNGYVYKKIIKNK